MFIDTHCHINILTKKKFDIPMSKQNFIDAEKVVSEAKSNNITHIINVGTSLVESLNCIELAKQFSSCYSAIGIHPNDATSSWKNDLQELKKQLLYKKEYKIVAIGECGMDFHYPDYNVQRQKDAFRAQIELALENNLALIIHTRDAQDETLKILDEYKNESNLRGTIHCFSEDQSFADHAIELNFVLGIGGTSTYPRNNSLRDVIKNIGLDHIILETDAPFLPPQTMRGKKNHPKNITIIAQYLAELLDCSIEQVSKKTNENVSRIFGIL